MTELKMFDRMFKLFSPFTNYDWLNWRRIARLNGFRLTRPLTPFQLEAIWLRACGLVWSMPPTRTAQPSRKKSKTKLFKISRANNCHFIEEIPNTFLVGNFACLRIASLLSSLKSKSWHFCIIFKHTNSAQWHLPWSAEQQKTREIKENLFVNRCNVKNRIEMYQTL